MVRPLRVFPDTGTPTTLGQMQDSDRIDRLMLPSRVAPFTGVKSISIIAPPPSPYDGDAYLIPVGAEGAWASNVGNAVAWDTPTASWVFYGPFEGWQLWVDSLGYPITYNGVAWVLGPFNPMTTAGDLVVAGPQGLPTRLAPGSNAQVLTMVAGVPTWSSSASSFPAYSVANNNEVLTIVAGAPAWANIPAQLPGSSAANNAQVLTVVSGNPAWATLPSQLPGYSAINNGQVLTISAGSPSWLSPASGLPASTGSNNGQVLTVVSGAAAWTALPAQLPVYNSSINGEVLTVVGGAPAWAANPAMLNPMTTAGDLIIGGTTGAGSRLGIGTTGYVLTVVGGAPAWAAIPAQLPTYNSSINGEVLTVVGGVPAWAAPSGGLSNPMTASGDLIIGGASGTPSRLAAGTEGYVLAITSGVPAWVTPPASGTVVGQIGAWTSYTPTLVNFTLGTGTPTLFWRREGDSMRIRGLITLGTGFSISGIMEFTLPSGYTVDSTKTQNVYDRLGVAGIFNSAINADQSLYSIYWVGATTNTFGIQGTTDAGVNNSFSSAFPKTWVATDGIRIVDLLVPIAQFSANINLTTDFQEFAYNTDTTTSNNTTAFAHDSGGVLLGSYAPSAYTFVEKVVQFNNPIKPTDILILEVQAPDNSGGVLWQSVEKVNIAVGATATFKYGMGINCGSLSGFPTNQVSVVFCSVVNALSSTWATYAGYGYKWRVRKVSQGSFAQAVPFDMLSNPVNPVNQVTAAATAALNTWNFCKASSAYSLTLPQASTNQGAVLGVEIDPFATALVTLAGYGGTDFIDYDNVNGTVTGRTSRIMQAGESAELKSTLSSTGVWYWHKTGGRSIPMTAALSNGGAQTFAASAETVLAFSTTLFNNGPSGLVVPASYRFVIQRPGAYRITSSLLTNSTNSSQTAITQRLYKNGAAIFSQVGAPVIASNSGPMNLEWAGNLVAGDYLQLAVIYFAGSFTTSVLIYADNTHNLFSLTEVSPW